MSWPRRLGAVVVDATTKVAGRRFVVRAARFALNRARLDIPNTIKTNGELMLQAHVVSGARRDELIRVFDIGANLGEWSLSMLRCAADAGRADDLDLHAFEASAFTAERLRASLSGHNVRVNQVGMSDRIGTGHLHVVAPGAGTNSLSHPAAPGAGTEDVPLTTVDEYCAALSIDSVDLLKVDTEGHDLLVLRGAGRMLDRRAIGYVQFEYNHRWIGQRSFLRDAFELLQPRGYVLGKLTPNGVEVYPDGWDWELESFVEGNYVAWHNQVAFSIPRIKWWKAGPPSRRRAGDG